MLNFFCTRCGAALAVSEEVAGNMVRCGRCESVVRTPGDSSLPVAEVVGHDFAEEASDVKPEDASARKLNYMPAWTGYKHVEDVDVLAERLEHVEAAEPANEQSAMVDCPYCGSTIPSYVGRCHFCRHPLRGS